MSGKTPYGPVTELDERHPTLVEGRPTERPELPSQDEEAAA